MVGSTKEAATQRVGILVIFEHGWRRSRISVVIVLISESEDSRCEHWAGGIGGNCVGDWSGLGSHTDHVWGESEGSLSGGVGVS